MAIKVFCILSSLLCLIATLRLRSHNWRIDSEQNFTKTNKTVIVDNLTYGTGNELYQFGSLTPDEYLSWKSRLADSGLTVYYCNQSYASKLYIQDLNGNENRCIQPILLTNQTDLAKDKILFNLETRQFQVCSKGKTPKCDTLIDQYDKTHEVPFQKAVLGLCPLTRPYYNPETKLCDDCPQLTEFDGPTQKCLPIIFTSNSEAKRIILTDLGSLSNQRYQIQQANPSRMVRDCPILSPYLRGTVCVNCSSDELFNLTSEQCVKGCEQGYFYSVESYECEKGEYFSDVAADNLVSQIGNYEAWKERTQKQSKASEKMIKCGSSAPFAVGGVCTSCSRDAPLFDVDKEKCVSCSTGRVYDSQKRRCLSYFDDSSSLSRMIANIS